MVILEVNSSTANALSDKDFSISSSFRLLCGKAGMDFTGRGIALCTGAGAGDAIGVSTPAHVGLSAPTPTPTPASAAPLLNKMLPPGGSSCSLSSTGPPYTPAWSRRGAPPKTSREPRAARSESDLVFAFLCENDPNCGRNPGANPGRPEEDSSVSIASAPTTWLIGFHGDKRCSEERKEIVSSEILISASTMKDEIRNWIENNSMRVA